MVSSPFASDFRVVVFAIPVGTVVGGVPGPAKNGGSFY